MIKIVLSVLRLLLTIAAASYVALAVLLLFFGDRIAFQPHPSSYRDNPAFLMLPVKNGSLLAALYLANPGARYLIICSHGNAEDIGDDLPMLEMIHRAGFAILAYDYEGYGLSSGQPSEKNAYADVDAAYDYAVQKLGFPPARIIAYGRSLGGAVAIDLASRRPVAGLIVESSFTSGSRVLTRVRLFPFDKFRSIDKIGKFHGPVLVMHGREDRVIPFSHGVKLFERAKQPKDFLWVDHAGHNDFPDFAGPAYVEKLQAFGKIVAQSGAVTR